MESSHRKYQAHDHQRLCAVPADRHGHGGRRHRRRLAHLPRLAPATHPGVCRRHDQHAITDVPLTIRGNGETMQSVSVCRRCGRGFTLVEALVALVVLSIGLLGIAGLQITSLKANHGSATRTQAVYLAYDIIDRMRANQKAAITDHAYDLAIDATPAGGTVAGDDLVAWRNNIKNALPTGSV